MELMTLAIWTLVTPIIVIAVAVIGGLVDHEISEWNRKCENEIKEENLKQYGNIGIGIG